MRHRQSRFADEIRRTERYGETQEIEYRGGKVIQQWRGSSGNVRLSHLVSCLDQLS